jgi:hypothetical protein
MNFCCKVRVSPILLSPYRLTVVPAQMTELSIILSQVWNVTSVIISFHISRGPCPDLSLYLSNPMPSIIFFHLWNFKNYIKILNCWTSNAFIWDKIKKHKMKNVLAFRLPHPIYKQINPKIFLYRFMMYSSPTFHKIGDVWFSLDFFYLTMYSGGLSMTVHCKLPHSYTWFVVFLCMEVM